MENEQAAIALLLFRVGPVLCCAPADPVQTIIAPQKLTRPPGSNEARPGIFYHAEHVVTVSELRHRFGVSEADREQPGRMIITLQGDAFIAYWVDEIIEVLDTPKEGWGEAPAYLPKGVFSKTLLLNDKIYLFAHFGDYENLPESDYLSQYFEKLKNNVLTEKVEEEIIPTESRANNIESTEAETALELETAEGITAAPDASEEQTTAVENETTHTEEPSHQELGQTSVSDIPSPDSGTVTADQTLVADNTSGQTEPVEQPQITIQSAQDAPQATMEVNTPSPETELEIESQAPNETMASTDLDEVPELTLTEQQDQATQQDDKPAFLKPVPAVVPESERPPEKPPLPWKSLAASLVVFISLGIIGAYYLMNRPEKNRVDEPVTQHVEVTRDNGPDDIDKQTEQPPKKAEHVQNNATVRKKETEQSNAKTDKDYRAEIQDDDEGVTIVLHSPEQEPVLKKDDKPENKITRINKTKTSTKKSSKSREEIIHIVAKGDTLWAIARHYVNNPYKYPQLARLSKIKNPDRIYPGNRVRILRHTKNGNQ